MTAPAHLTYVYAVVRDTERVRTAVQGIRGVSGMAVSLLVSERSAEPAEPRRHIAFIISRVAADEFDERTLKARFEDIQWLEGMARAHHEVVQTLAREDTVLPLRLATLYQDDRHAREALAAQHDLFAERIALLRDRSEWGVKLCIESPASSDDPAPDGRGSAGALSPGKAYLQRRRAQHSAREDRYHNAQEAAQRIDELVPRFRTHRVRHPAQRGALAGPEENVLNDAYLVPDELAEAFSTALAAVATDLEGVRVEVTGPWAPYSFAMPPPPPEPPGEDSAADGPAR
ncbi:GvpL/GvpF family gas vesicle protein [Streptomyces sp. SP18ES09]|uniref:GvpL/GvpF family gas vesicle protein n=1 Tax=Streptomyces sp. SP18ES09 TaxID=3002532 RepID=UPI002E79CDAD|nr:GvpL/GvpF family gas vesicle protein [Streptomyces sp. SP18ES09]MEE1814440.1 GvpL/GvpF family gas vesicle protein [Streptomyces sp. SP18ES09]